MTYALVVMKILISIGTLGLGGAEKQAVWLANRLSEHHDVTLLTYHGGVREKDLSPNVDWETIFEIEVHGQELDIHPGDSIGLEQPNSPQSITTKSTKYIQVTSNNFFSKQALKWNAKALIRLMGLNKIFVSIVYKFALTLRKLMYRLTLPKLRGILKSHSYVFRQARKKLKNAKPDLIITFLFHDTLNIGLASLLQLKRPRLIVGRRSPIGYGDNSRKLIDRIMLRVIYKFSSLAVTNSSGNLESAFHDGLAENKIIHINNFVKSQDSQLELNNSEETNLICVANFFEYKNHRNLIVALSAIDSETKFQVTFVGEGPTRAEMIALSSDLKLNAVFYTHEEQAKNGLFKANFVLLPSFYEGSSNVLLEGLAKGIPAIVTNVGHVPTLVKMGAPFSVSNGTDSKSLGAALQDGLESESRLRKEASNFKLIIERDFSEAKILQDWLQLIESD